MLSLLYGPTLTCCTLYISHISRKVKTEISLSHRQETVPLLLLVVVFGWFVFSASPTAHQNGVVCLSGLRKTSRPKGNISAFLPAISFVFFFFPGRVHIAHQHNPRGPYPPELVGKGEDRRKGLGEGASSVCSWL